MSLTSTVAPAGTWQEGGRPRERFYWCGAGSTAFVVPADGEPRGTPAPT